MRSLLWVGLLAARVFGNYIYESPALRDHIEFGREEVKLVGLAGLVKTSVHDVLKTKYCKVPEIMPSRTTGNLVSEPSISSR